MNTVFWLVLSHILSMDEYTLVGLFDKTFSLVPNVQCFILLYFNWNESLISIRRVSISSLLVYRIARTFLEYVIDPGRTNQVYLHTWKLIIVNKWYFFFYDGFHIFFQRKISMKIVYASFSICWRLNGVVVEAGVWKLWKRFLEQQSISSTSEPCDW